IAFIIFSFIRIPREIFALFRNDNAGLAAVSAYQYLDHVGHASMLHTRSLAHGFLDAGGDAEIERCNFRSGHK
ncbi:MAG: hypothetical protein VYC03_05160, partial [Pseudomonadota bacterium]|nr:hypothetical protein [Pseudomonadota bacterium]